MSTNRPKLMYYILFLVIAILMFMLSLLGLSAKRFVQITDPDTSNNPTFEYIIASDTKNEPTTEEESYTQTQETTIATELLTTEETTTEIPETTEVVTEPPITAPPVTEPTVTDPPETEPPETEPVIIDYGEIIPGAINAYARPLGERAGDEFFEDALFVGDSRTNGIRIYGNIKNAKYYAYDGLGAQTAMYNTFIEENGEYLTITQAIANHPEYKKIFICLGINEFYRSESIYRSKYTALIDEIMSVKAEDAQVYMYSMFPVSAGIKEQKHKEGLNNTHLMALNRVALEIAMSRGIHFIDVTEAFIKPDGYRYLDENESYDGVHLYREKTVELCEYIRTHV